MVDIYNINKFVKSCGDRWLIEACPINAVLSLHFSNSECWVQVVKVMKEFSFNPLCFFFFYTKLILYMWFLDRIEGCFENAGHVRRGRQDLSVLGRCGQSSVSAFGAELMLKVVVTVLTDTHRRRDLQSFDLWLEAAAPVKWGNDRREWEVHLQVRQNFGHFLVRTTPSIISKGMVYFWQKSCPQFLQWWRRSVREKRMVQPEQLSTTSSFTQWSAAERPGWSLTDQLKTRPRPSPTRILLWSLSREWMGGGGYLKTKEELVLTFGRWFFLLGDGEGCDLSWLSVVLAIKRSVHGEFAPEHQLALPSVPCRHPQIHIQTSWNQKNGTTKHQQMKISVCGVFCEATASIFATELRSQSELWLWKDLKQSLSAHLFWVGYSVVGLRWRAEKAAILSSGLD